VFPAVDSASGKIWFSEAFQDRIGYLVLNLNVATGATKKIAMTTPKRAAAINKGDRQKWLSLS
jgi:site-specific recombinase